MGEPRTRYYEKKEKWRIFEEDDLELKSNHEKYAGISSRPESLVFVYRVKGKQLKSFQRLADIYKFKLDWEKEHG